MWRLEKIELLLLLPQSGVEDLQGNTGSKDEDDNDDDDESKGEMRQNKPQVRVEDV